MNYVAWFNEFKHLMGGYRTATEVAALDPEEEFIRAEFNNGVDPATAVASYLSY
jgi:hypothetical protein